MCECAGVVLSLFPGIGLMDRGFEAAGFAVVRGPDLLWGGDVRRFHAAAGRFDGVIGGSPCQGGKRVRREMRGLLGIGVTDLGVTQRRCCVFLLLWASGACGSVVRLGSGDSLRGVTGPGVQVVIADGAVGVVVEGSSFSGIDGDAIFIGAGARDWSIVGCTFSGVSGSGIYGYPGDGGRIVGNTFDAVYEPVHLSAACDGLTVQGNVITHATRIGIELQKGMTHLLVDGNSMSSWLPHVDGAGVDSHIGISCATGGYWDGSEWVGFGSNITISNNVLLQTGPDAGVSLWAKTAIEIMGESNVLITGNDCEGWGTNILNGMYSAGGRASDNRFVGGAVVADDVASWPIAPWGSAGGGVAPRLSRAAVELSPWSSQLAGLEGALHLYGESSALGLGFLVGLRAWRLVLASKGAKLW